MNTYIAVTLLGVAFLGLAFVVVDWERSRLLLRAAAAEARIAELEAKYEPPLPPRRAGDLVALAGRGITVEPLDPEQAEYFHVTTPRSNP